MSVKPTEPHQQRVINEKDDLDKKIIALKRFVNSDSINLASEGEQELLKKQLVAMVNYSDILMARISAW